MQQFVTLVGGVFKSVAAGIQASLGASDSGKVVVTDASGRVDQSFMPVGIGADIKSVLASENLSAGNFVNVWNNAGTANVRKADATTAGKEAHGFVLSAFSSGTSALVYFEGNNTAVSGATVGNLFLSTTAGGFTSTPPSSTGNIVQRIGVSTDATSVNVEFKDPIELA